MKKLYAILAGGMLAAALSGCAETHQAAYTIGQPVGSAAAVPRSAMQGAVDGYTPNSNQNPYLR